MTEIEKTISYEGGYSNDPFDPGGETKYGISKKSYPDLDIASLTLQDAISIYTKDYWDSLQCDAIVNKKVRWKLFDMAVNTGVVTTVKAVQSIVGCDIDGVLGPQTLHYINASDPDNLVNKLINYQCMHYADICLRNSTQVIFLKGWLRRALDRGEDL